MVGADPAPPGDPEGKQDNAAAAAEQVEDGAGAVHPTEGAAEAPEGKPSAPAPAPTSEALEQPDGAGAAADVKGAEGNDSMDAPGGPNDDAQGGEAEGEAIAGAVGAARRVRPSSISVGATVDLAALPPDFWRTASYQKPSKERALYHRRQSVFQSGTAPVCSTHADDLADMGSGVALYFMFVRCMSCLFLAMAVIATPAFMIALAGERIEEDETDALGLVKLSLANNGRPVAALNLTACEQSTGCNVTVPVFDVFGVELEDTELAYVVTAVDLLYSTLFLFVALWLRRLVRRVSRVVDKASVTTADYAVMVRGLPVDATAAEIRDHFDRLYALDQPDWENRGVCCGSCLRHKPRSNRDIRAGPDLVARSKMGATEATMGGGGEVGASAASGSVDLPGPPSQAQPGAGPGGAGGASSSHASGPAPTVVRKFRQLLHPAPLPPPAGGSRLHGGGTVPSRAGADGGGGGGGGGGEGEGEGGGEGGGLLRRGSTLLGGFEITLAPVSAVIPGVSPVRVAEVLDKSTGGKRAAVAPVATGPGTGLGGAPAVAVATGSTLVPASAGADCTGPNAGGDGKPSVFAETASTAASSRARYEVAASRRTMVAKSSSSRSGQADLSQTSEPNEVPLLLPSGRLPPPVDDEEAAAAAAWASEADARTARGEWVAEVAVALHDGRRLRYFLARRKLVNQLRRARALVLKHVDAFQARHGHRPDLQALGLVPGPSGTQAAAATEGASQPRVPRRLRRACRALIKAEAAFGVLTRRQAGSSGSPRRSRSSSAGAGAVTSSTAAAGLPKDDASEGVAGAGAKAPDSREAPPEQVGCAAAFVTFNHEESWARCLADHGTANSGRLRRACCFPRALRFRGRHKLRVVQAPDPSDVLWEHLDTSACSRCMRRALTGLVTTLLLIGSLILIAIAQRTKNDFADRTPDLSLCETEIPAAYFGTYGFPADASLTRGTAEEDARCGSSAFYLTYPTANLTAPPLVDVSAGVQAYNLTGEDPCRSVCVDPGDSTSCSGLACVDGEERARTGRACLSFDPAAVAACFCKDLLISKMKELGVINGGLWVNDNASDLCGDFIADFVLGHALTFLAAFGVVVVNTLLKTFLRALATFEHHSSVTSQMRAVFIKVFVASFLNTALIVLIVQADGLPWGGRFPIGGVGAFEGEHEDFTVGWYTTAGTSVMFTMLLNIVAPHVGPVMKAFRQCCCRPCKRRSAATQEEMNGLYVGSEMKLDTRFPLVLNTVYVTTFFCGGLPVLLVAGSLALACTYWIDKMLLLRHYQRPPRVDSALAWRAVSLLPGALILHLCISAWMYGNDQVFYDSSTGRGLLNPSAIVGSGSDSEVQEKYEQWKADVEEYDPVGFVPKAVRNNVWPIIVYLAVLLLLTFVYKVALKGFVGLVLRVVRICTCGRLGRIKAGDVLLELNREFNPALTEDFVKQVPDEIASGEELTVREIKHGWRVELVEAPDGSWKKRVMVKVWTEREVAAMRRAQASKLAGVGRKDAKPETADDKADEADADEASLPRVNQRKRTWEVIGEDGLASYDIRLNHKYKAAVAAERARIHSSRK